MPLARCPLPVFAEILFGYVSVRQRSPPHLSRFSGLSRRALFKMRNHIPSMNLCSQLYKRRKNVQRPSRPGVGGCLAGFGCFGCSAWHLFWSEQASSPKDFASRIQPTASSFISRSIALRYVSGSWGNQAHREISFLNKRSICYELAEIFIKDIYVNCNFLVA